MAKLTIGWSMIFLHWLAMTICIALMSCSSYRGHHTLAIVEDITIDDPCESMTWITKLESIEVDIDGDKVSFRGQLGEFLKEHVGSSSLHIERETRFVLDAAGTGRKRAVSGCEFEPTAEFHFIRPPSQPR